MPVLQAETVASARPVASSAAGLGWRAMERNTARNLPAIGGILSPNLILTRSYLCLIMIFSENRFPLFGIMARIFGILTIKGKGKLSGRVHACG
ncbi:hypothetical protein [Mesorhizobium sp. B4-1-4]|uniref:hypothetical protein n=1 Tax=Mesorhizobium sp. B4-1-4 TaxID=2589888 RepID=UPI0015E3FDCB|nr:hypothetical protein [Mesorhizobium sp. B4-1-4]UCI34955.1 hypothetical protein FJW03_17165 [Mesorhizobium sp. B4-1-4]